MSFFKKKSLEDYKKELEKEKQKLAVREIRKAYDDEISSLKKDIERTKNTYTKDSNFKKNVKSLGGTLGKGFVKTSVSFAKVLEEAAKNQAVNKNKPKKMFDDFRL